MKKQLAVAVTDEDGKNLVAPISYNLRFEDESKHTIIVQCAIEVESASKPEWLIDEEFSIRIIYNPPKALNRFGSYSTEYSHLHCNNIAMVMLQHRAYEDIRIRERIHDLFVA